MNALEVTLYAEDGAVVLGVEDDDAAAVWPLTPDVADELADRLRDAAQEARKQNPGAVQ